MFLDGIVVELLPAGMVRVKLAAPGGDGEELTAHVAEEFRRISTPVKPGDRVRIKRAERDPNRGSIVARASSEA